VSEIAIVGLDARFPGAGDLGALWSLLLRGEDGIQDIPPQRWRSQHFHCEYPAPGRTNARAAGFISDADAFDYEFFGISPREAQAMDPQQRLLLQTSWRALEDATLDPRSQAGSRTGVFVGVMTSEWAHLHITDYDNVTPHVGTGNGPCMMANRLSYFFDLKGPSMAVDTACSSSLVASQLGCAALRAGECDQVIVAGVSLMLLPAMHIFYAQAGLSAPDGRCKPFSAKAQGIGRGEGVAVAVMRRLEDAEREGLPIYAVIKGGAVNQDGRSNGLTAPNRGAQRDVIREAYRRAGVRPEEIAFVEAHGTGTVLGDHIEASALGDIHAVARASPCVIGSIKGNIGHTEGAAGLAGLIKATLALHYGVLPASLHAASENPQLRLAEKGLQLAKRAERLSARRPLAAVSSFGLGGTNAHLVLAGAPPPAPTITPPPQSGILTVSAPDLEGLRRNAAYLAEDLTARSPRWFTQFCWTSNRVKSSGRWRLAVVAGDRDRAVALLREAIGDGARWSALSGHVGASVTTGWLFTGQGSQYQGMSRALYRRSSLYRKALASVDQHLAPLLGRPVASVLFDDGEVVASARLAQPALFAVGYALGQLLAEAGVSPAWMIGHSVGEYAAAVHAGVLDLADACHLVYERGRLMDSLPERGSMLAVRCSGETAAELIGGRGRLEIAAYNAPDGTVISGATVDIEKLGADLDAMGITSRRLNVSHAFHSQLMDPMLESFAAIAAKVPHRSARLCLVSTLTGGRVGTQNEPMDGHYWVRQVREPVRFESAYLAAVSEPPQVTHLIELGPGSVLTGIVRRIAAVAPHRALLPCPGPKANGLEMLECIARLYTDGARIQWDALYDEGHRVRRRLRPYEFSTQHRFWHSVPHEAARTIPGPGEPVDDLTVSGSAAGNVVPFERGLSTAEVPEDHWSREVLDLIGRLGGYPSGKIHMNMRLVEDLGYDSIVVVKLKDHLERSWERSIDLQDLLSGLTTVGELIEVLRGQTPQAVPHSRGATLA
jgi:acyl transferase domain-containing protein